MLMADTKIEMTVLGEIWSSPSCGSSTCTSCISFGAFLAKDLRGFEHNVQFTHFSSYGYPKVGDTVTCKMRSDGYYEKI